MVAGYEEELRNLMREPHFFVGGTMVVAYLGQRVLSVLFWFVVSLALTAATPSG